MDSKITVVVGPPAAGKSTYVQEHRNINDVVIDADALSLALGAPSAHRRDGSHREVMFKARQAAIYAVLDGIKDNAWIIHTNPGPVMTDLYLERGVSVVLLDPGKETVLARAKEDRRPDGTTQAIEAWYANPPDLKARTRKKGVVYLDTLAPY